jgi:hypothetical protein
MNDSSDATLKLLVQIGVVGKEDVKAANDLLADTKSLGGESAIPENLAGLKKTGEAMQDVGEKTKISNRELRILTSQLGKGIPGASELMRAAVTDGAEAATGGIFLLIAGVEMLRSAMERIDADKKEDLAMETSLQDEQTKSVEKVRDALDSAEISEAEFHHKFIENSRDAIDKAEQLSQAILKSAIAANEAGDTKRKGIADSEIEDMEKRGVITHAAALKMKEQLDIEYEQGKVIRMMATDALEMRLVQQQAYQKHVALETATNNEAAAQATYQAAATAKAANDTKIEEGKEQIAKGQAALNQLAAKGVDDESLQRLNDAYKSEGGKDDQASESDKFTYLARKFLTTGTYDPSKDFGTDGDVRLELYRQAQLDIASGKQAVGAGNAKKVGVDTNEGNAKTDLDDAHSQLLKARDAIAALQEKITEMSATNVLKEAGAQSDLGLDKASSALTKDRATADNPSGASDADRNQLITDASKIAGHNVDLQTAAKIIEFGANNMGAFMNQVQALAAVLGRFTPAQAADLQKQIDALSAQVNAQRHGNTFG